MVKVGDEIEVKILRVDSDERKIGLSRKRVEWSEELEEAHATENSMETENGTSPSVASEVLQGGIGGDSGPLFKSASELAPESLSDGSEPSENPEE